MPRLYNRQPHQLRPVRITPDAVPYAEGSCLIEMGHTRVLCAASVEIGVPPWLRDQPQGWITAEYALLPRSTTMRTRRERSYPSGRTQEIQRLIGRSLRLAVDLTGIEGYTITLDCDVVQADGGTRTASITGGYVALVLALNHMCAAGSISRNPLRCALAAVSVGVVQGKALLDLDYSEDSTAEVDCNIVQTEQGELVEVQSTAEQAPINRVRFNELLDLADQGIAELLEYQQEVISKYA